MNAYVRPGTTPCPDCGEDIHPKGLARHRGGRRCQAAVNLSAMFSQGYVNIPHYFEALVKRVHAPYEYARTRYVPGAEHRRSVLAREMWVPAWVGAVLRLRTNGILTFAGPVKLSTRMLEKALRAEVTAHAEVP